MPKPRSRKRWEHPTYKYAYCIERNGIVYTIIDGSEKIAIKGLTWDLRNKQKALTILNERLIELHNSQTKPQNELPKTIHEAIELFGDLKFPSMRPSQKTRFLNALSKYLPEDLLLSDKIGIQKQIIKYQTQYNHSHNYIRKIMQYLSRFFDFCVDNDLILKNPISDDMKLKEKKIDKIIPTTTEMNLIIKYFTDNDKQEYGDYFKFLSLTAMRSMEALKVYWDVESVPYIPNSLEKSIISINNNMMVIDGKRSKYDEPKLREFPLTIIPGLYEFISKLHARSISNKVFKWNSIAVLQRELKEAVAELNLNDKYNMRSIRRYATNYWEKELGIPSKICEFLAGHTEDVRDKYYGKSPTANQILNMYNLSDSSPIESRNYTKKNYDIPALN